MTNASLRKEKAMGLFDFTKNVGVKLFIRDDKAAEEIKKHIETNNPGIVNLGVNFNDGVVLLSGQATSAEAMEKTVLLAGNVKRVSRVNIDALQTPLLKEKVEYYVIKEGDKLSSIAKQFYGQSIMYPKIIKANKEVIKNAKLIYPGQKIRIPLE